jgi:hypothetical protein
LPWEDCALLPVCYDNVSMGCQRQSMTMLSLAAVAVNYNLSINLGQSFTILSWFKQYVIIPQAPITVCHWQNIQFTGRPVHVPWFMYQWHQILARTQMSTIINHCWSCYACRRCHWLGALLLHDNGTQLALTFWDKISFGMFSFLIVLIFNVFCLLSTENCWKWVSYNVDVLVNATSNSSRMSFRYVLPTGSTRALNWE